ncbi:MAG: glycosyltransferase family 4 protein [Nitritalea sp.]
MKIVIVNTFEQEGGAARAAERLYHALKRYTAHEVYYLVQYKSSSDPDVLQLPKRFPFFPHTLKARLDKVDLLKYPERSTNTFTAALPRWNTLVDTLNALQPDIVHLHWVSAGMLHVDDIPKIQAEIVWTLHDMWPFTGGCHYDGSCGRYTQQCGACPVLGSTDEKDISARIFQRKKKAYGRRSKPLHIVGLSRWLHEAAKSSTLFRERQHYQLPNPIDTSLFFPIARSTAREALGLPETGRIILFGAMSATTNPIKGYSFVEAALSGLANKEELRLVIFGASEGEAERFGIPVQYVGTLRDTVSLRLLYNAADVMLVPSKQENLSNSIMEALACGTPVCSFAIGGNGDMIQHKQNGYLARPFEVEDYRAGIEWLLEKADTSDLRQAARAYVLEHFEAKKVAERYEAMYASILS